HPERSILPRLDPAQFLSSFDRIYRVRSFLYSGKNWPNLSSSHNLCLALHSSMESLQQLLQVTRTFSGPISLSLFTPGPYYGLINLFLQHAAKCHPKVMRNLAIHVMFPIQFPLTIEDIPSNTEVNCSTPYDLTRHRLAAFKKLVYPESRMRNLAQRGCPTPFTFIFDIDMRIPEQFDKDVEYFLATKGNRCPKCIFIIPVYEVDGLTAYANLPRNKTELLDQVKSKKARIYHIKTYPWGQKMSHLEQWEKLPKDVGPHVAYELEKYQFTYEPIFIGPTSMPSFDERFTGFGLCRNTQFYELFVAGFQFHLLNDGFLIHMGFKVPGERKPWKSKELLRNQRLVPQFAQEIKVKYGRDPCQMSLKLRTYRPSKWKDIDCPINEKPLENNVQSMINFMNVT
ncbi:hypothetical protein TCAL_12514, partial [Tigriopus californicus]